MRGLKVDVSNFWELFLGKTILDACYFPITHILECFGPLLVKGMRKKAIGNFFGFGGMWVLIKGHDNEILEVLMEIDVRRGEQGFK